MFMNVHVHEHHQRLSFDKLYLTGVWGGGVAICTIITYFVLYLTEESVGWGNDMHNYYLFFYFALHLILDLTK